MVSRIRYVLLVLLMLAATPAGEAIAQQKPEKPVRKEPHRLEPDKPDKPAKPAEEPRSCCRTCSKGKACGDACISRRLTCRKPPGCACDSGAN